MAHRTALTATLSALALSLLFFVTGCDFDGAFTGGSSPLETGTNSLDPDAMYTAIVGGSVGDGPIVGAHLTVLSRDGKTVLHEGIYSGSTADYEIQVRAQGRHYPLTIIAEGGVDIVTNDVPDFDLESVILGPGRNVIANLNPFSTLIVDVARKGGTISDASIDAATDAVMGRYGFGLNPEYVTHPIFDLVNDRNIHVMVKASEAMGEMVRRTRDELISIGMIPDGNDIMHALAADMVDGWIDGRGAEGHDPLVAAVANVASGAVMVEAMMNQLHVYRNDATLAMDLAIRQVRPLAPKASINTSNVPIPAEALEQTRRALRAALIVATEPHAPLIEEAYQVLAGASPGVTEIQGMPSGIRAALNAATLQSARATPSQIEDINRIARGEEPGEAVDQDRATSGDLDDGVVDDNGLDEGISGDDGDGGFEDGFGGGDGIGADDGVGGDGGAASNTDPGDATSDAGSVEPEILWDNSEIEVWQQFQGGEDDRIRTGMSLTELGDGSFTVEAVVQYLGETSRTWSPIFGASHGPGYESRESFFIGKERNSNQLNINIGGLGRWILDSAGLFDGGENHLAVVFNASENDIRVYVNGNFQHLRSVGGSLTARSELLLGAVGHDANERWFGWIGPVRVTAAALQATAFMGGEDDPLPPRPNRAPVISGSPSTTALMVGELWSFTPNASDPDHDPIKFSIQNQPPWAKFDPQTGRLEGIAREAGSYSGITISVEDSYGDSASLDPFTLHVDEATLGTATVSWEAPTTRTDGSPLPSSELAGYRVYWGTDPNNLERMDQIDNQGLLSLHIANLEKGTWHFAVTAICSQGLESPKSEIGSKTIM